MTDQIKYTVWVGGVDIVEDVDLELAEEVYSEWIDEGYDDVVIERRLA